jgi:hypothetical protein
MIIQPQFVMPGAAQVEMVTRGLVSRWEINEGAVATLTDEHGSNHLTKTGTIGTYDTDGVIGLDAVGTGYYSVSDNSSLLMTGGLTVVVRVNIPSMTRTANQGAIGHWHGASPWLNQRSYLLSLSDQTLAGSINFAISSNGQYAGALETPAYVFPKSEWVVIAGRFIPSSRISLFVNGVEESYNATSIPASVYNATVPLALLTNYAYSDYKYALYAVMDWARLYNVALTDEEIALISSGAG